MMGIAAEVAERLRAPTAALEAAGAVALAGVQHAFEAEGPNWKPLAPATIRERRQLGFGPGPKLQRTRVYRRSYKATVRGDRLTIGSEDSRAGSLNAARPIVLSDEDQRAVADTLTAVLTGRGA
jgi:hypothetical protein